MVAFVERTVQACCNFLHGVGLQAYLHAVLPATPQQLVVMAKPALALTRQDDVGDELVPSSCSHLLQQVCIGNCRRGKADAADGGIWLCVLLLLLAQG
jgi:hypothetical protein